MNGEELLEQGLRRGIALWRIEDELDWQENQGPRRAAYDVRKERGPATTLEGVTDMRNETELAEAGRQYAAAYAAHYTGRDLPVALQLYRKVMSSHPGAQEADYSRMQVQNIVNAVVPKQELLDAQVELALAHFEHGGPTDAGRIPVRALASALPA